MSHFRFPQNQSYEDTVNFLTHEQFPAIVERSVEVFAHLPKVGTYQHLNSSTRSFQEALLETTGRQYTLSGVGSLIDYDRFGQQIKRPTPQLIGSPCAGNSLCLEPTCFGFQEGVIENNNMLQRMCWSLSMPCLKDYYYSDMNFERKMKSYFAMFFKQAPAVSQAYQRTRLLKEAIKVVCTDVGIRYTGPVIGGSSGISLPFYINPASPTEFPSLTDIQALGADIGGANLDAFENFLAPRLFAGNFEGGMETVKVYGQKPDYRIAQEQTWSAKDNMAYMEMMRSMPGSEDGFIHDGLFPTFKVDGGYITPITQEILEEATIAGYVQTDNPEHALAEYRGLLFVPANWMFDLVEPPKDNFADLGIGSLNFGQNTPGVYQLLSSSLFSGFARSGKEVIIGNELNNKGQVITRARGVQGREKAIREAVRTELLLTYSQRSFSDDHADQLPRVGQPVVPQSSADGFALKSTMYLASSVYGTARPVLMLFRVDNPRSAKAIKVCSSVDITVDQTAGNEVVAAAPGGQEYLVVTFRNAIGTDFAVDDELVYRTGIKGASYLVDVTAKDGKVLSIQSQDHSLLPACAGGKDDYGVQAQLIKNTGATAVESEIMKASYDSGSTSLFLELFDPIAATIDNASGVITLESGDSIDVEAVGAGEGVFIQVDAAAGEACDLSTLDCATLVNATISFA